MLATTIQFSNTTPHHQDGGTPLEQPECCLRTQQCVWLSLVVAHPALAHYRREPLTACTPPVGVLFVVLLRKEVIQPHLPVRLPCYDFVPIADPTFDSSPPYGLGHWLRVLPTFMT